MLSSKTVNQKAMLALAWVSIFWGTTWLASKIGLAHMPALQMIGLRQFFGGAIFVLFFLFKRHPLPRGRQWLTILILSILNFMFSNGLVILGVKYISSGLGAIIGAIFPLWLVVITIARGKKMLPKAIAGMLIGFSGVCVIFYEHLKDLLNADFRFGIILSLIGSVTWAFATLYTKEKADHFNPYYSLGFQMMISSIVFLGAAYGTGNTIALTAIPAASVWAILYLVTFGSALTFAAYIYALRNLPVSLTSIYAYINPVVAVLLGAAVLNEKLNGYIAVGGLLTLAGVYLVNDSFKKKGILEN